MELDYPICPLIALSSLLGLIVLLPFLALLLVFVGVQLWQHLVGVRVHALAVVLCNIIVTNYATLQDQYDT